MWILGTDGHVFPFGAAADHGSTTNLPLWTSSSPPQGGKQPSGSGEASPLARAKALLGPARR